MFQICLTAVGLLFDPEILQVEISHTVTMPRTYKPSAGARGYTSGQPDGLHTAFAELQNGMSERAVCSKYGFSRTKFRNFVKVQRGEEYRLPGGQTVLTPATEQSIVNHLLAVSEWGFPFDMVDLRMCVKHLLDKDGINVPKFKDNMPGEDWASGFMLRHKERIKVRMCQNISKKRAGISSETVSDYFDELEKTLAGVPPENIINYDETNLTDDPGRKRMIFKRGARYPERILNTSKSSTSLMLAGTASGEVLPLYVVYKSEHMWSTWRQGGPRGIRFNRSKSGWFDHICFIDWFRTVALPYCTGLPGKKVLIGDNLSSHFSDDILKACTENNIAFVCLPPNATHLCQPLDVAYFRPMKIKWRSVLSDWKQSARKTAGTVPKEEFPRLLKKLMSEMPNQKENLLAGFRKCGIHPLDRQPVLNRLPRSADEANPNDSVSDVFLNHLKELRNDGEQGKGKKRGKRTRVDVVPGRSVCGSHSEEENEPGPSGVRPSVETEEEPEQEVLSDTSDSDCDEPCDTAIASSRNVFQTFSQL